MFGNGSYGGELIMYKPKPFQNSSDLLKMYRVAFEKVKYLQDIDDKLLAYNEVINYCANSKLCLVDDSIKRNQILFWTYNNIGDMFLARNSDVPETNNYVYAVQYYQNALSFTKSSGEKFSTLEKIAHVYGELHDEKMWQKTLEQMVFETEDGLKRQAFVELAQKTDDLKLKAKYLENALNFIVDENVSALSKCQNTLKICAYLLEIYKVNGNKKAYARIKELQKNTLELLN